MKSFLRTIIDQDDQIERLRRKLEERVRVWGKVADKLESADHMSNAEVVRSHISQLTHILEGES